MFLDALRDAYLIQHIDMPTRYRHGQKPHILDLLLTSEDNMIDNVEYQAGLGLSDHIVITCNLQVRSLNRKKVEPRFRYHKGDYQMMNQNILAMDWESELNPLTADKSWTLFTSVLNDQMKSHIPTSVPSKDKRRKIWMTREATAKHKRKQQAWKQYQHTGERIDYIRATTEKNEFTTLTRNLCRDFERKLAGNLKNNPKDFWRYCKSKLKNKTGLGDIRTEEGNLTSDDLEKADILNRYFTSVFTREDTVHIPPMSKRLESGSLTEIVITPDLVEKKLSKLKVCKSAGPDGFHPRILNELSSSIKEPLWMIFQKSLLEGRLPEVWKNAHITPIHKKGSKTTPGNYRPVSLTSVIGKVMESTIRDQLVRHMMENNLFCDAQHGFVPGRSCMTQLLITLELWSELLDGGDPVDVIYLDFRKAFDTVPHRRLLKKLEAYGIKGGLLTWIENFLSGRKQRVVVNGKLSSWADILSGIPQGSVLGPILFVIFINDLPDEVLCTAKIFADDAKLFRGIRSPEDRMLLQDDLNRLVEWSQRWQMGFNESKCKVLHLGSSNPGYEYSMKNTSLESITDEKDLGVTIDQDLKFHLHVSKAVNKASRMLRLVRATFTCLDETTLPKLFTTMVRPHLEYGNVIWCPRFQRDKLEVEKIQRRATKLIPNLRSLPYKDRLVALRLPSLFYRRRRGDMLQVYKILMGIDRLEPSQFFSLADQTYTRGHSLKVVKKRSRSSLRQNVFSQRITNDWNALPEDVVTSPTLNTFKSRLDKHWKRERYNLP